WRWCVVPSIFRVWSLLSFFFPETATTQFSTLPYTTLFRSGLAHREVHRELADDRLSGARRSGDEHAAPLFERATGLELERIELEDRKSTRLNSSHVKISYAVFCLKKKKNIIKLLIFISQTP